MNTSNINLNDLYFEYKVLTKIVGEPNFDKLHVLFRELKANTAAVPCTLAGGANGYLGMLVSPAQYQTVAPGTPFVPPVAPGALTIAPGDTQYQIMMAKTQYETALREHQTYILLQRSLISLVQDAVENKYTNAIRNRITGQLPADIRVIKNHLFGAYGRINESELQAKYDETTRLSYDISHPIDDIYNAIEDLCEIAEFAENVYSEKQKVHIGFLVMSKQPIFRSDLRKWMRKPAVDKTWLNFMSHFRQAHQELRDTDTSMEELGYQSANAIVEQIVARLQEEDNTPPPTTYPYPSPSPTPTPTAHIAYPPPEYIPPPTLQPPPNHHPPPPQANAVTPVDTNAAAMQVMMQNMQLMHDNMHQQYYHGRGRGRGRGNGRGRGRGGGRGRTQGHQSSGGSYCHTHGNCAHGGTECRTPGPNHVNEATFANMMGGSTNRCYWINE